MQSEADSNTTPAIFFLPDETMLDILTHFDKYDNRNLAALSLTCRRLHSFITPQLYRAVRLTKDSAALLKRTLTEHSSLAQTLKSLQFYSKDCSCGNDGGHSISEVVQLCTALEEFVYVNGDMTEHPHTLIFEPLSNLPHLRSIECPAAENDLKLFPLGMKITSLTVDETPFKRLPVFSFMKDGGWSEQFPHLSEFHIQGHGHDTLSSFVLIWEHFPKLTLLTIDKLSPHHAGFLMDHGKAHFRHFEVIVNNKTHYTNLRVSLDPNKTSHPKPSAIVHFQWPLFYTSKNRGDPFLNDWLDVCKLATHFVHDSGSVDTLILYEGIINKTDITEDDLSESFKNVDLEGRTRTMDAAKSFGDMAKAMIDKFAKVPVRLELRFISEASAV